MLSRLQSEPKLKFLVVGLGGIGQRHVRNLRTLYGDNIELLAFRTRGLGRVLTDRLEVEQGTDVVEKYGIRAFSDLDEALDQRPDAALICNPTSLHVPTATEAAERGCHLFLEKPVAASMEGVDELLKIVREKKLTTLVGYQLRYHPAIRNVLKWVAAGRIGRILSVRAEVGEYLPGWHKYEDYRESYAALESLGGGVILTQIHEFDILYALFGKLPHKLVTFGGKLSPLEVGVEDIASTLMEFEKDGLRVPVHLHQDYIQRPASRNAQILGESGKIRLDLTQTLAELYDFEGSIVEKVHLVDFQRNVMFLDLMKDFVEAVSGKSRPMVDLEQGVQSLKMALSARESLQSNGRLRGQSSGQ